MSNVFFTADLHLGHRYVAGIRGFGDDIAGHDETVVHRWNTLVGPRDEVWLLGDVALQKPQDVLPTLRRLQGRVHVLPGNHDDRRLLKHLVEDLGWVVEPGLVDAKFPDPAVPSGRRRVTLCHYPLLTWKQAHHGAYHLHGHSHGNLQGPATTRVDVGLDCWSLAPVPWEGLRSDLRRQTYVPVDHHEVKEGVNDGSGD